jgi:ERCC4-type nuclease
MRSSNMEETAYIICNAIMKITKEKDKKAFYGNPEETNPGSEKTEVSYSSVIKSKKNSNVTPENIGEIVLCQIPSINSVSAVCIMKKFKTISNLIQSIKEDDKCLNDITYETEKKQTRKISKTVISNIITYLKN